MLIVILESAQFTYLGGSLGPVVDILISANEKRLHDNDQMGCCVDWCMYVPEQALNVS